MRIAPGVLPGMILHRYPSVEGLFEIICEDSEVQFARRGQPRVFRAEPEAWFVNWLKV
jgi:hypothetical protein